MKLGIMQPYFFPYVGYFSLINYTDEFIFFDTPQYISHGWINRNRILKEDKTPGYITVPIKKCPQRTRIIDVQINNNIRWREKIWGQLTVYRRTAPYYDTTIEFLHSIIDDETDDSLAVLCEKSVINTCKYIGINSSFKVFSQMDLNIGEINAPDEWALYISKALHAEIYVNPPGGASFFDREKYEKNNIKLEYLKSNLKPYIQRIGHFEPALSIIDLMMFCDNSEIMEIINDYKIW